jgi:hypothetical protein
MAGTYNMTLLQGADREITLIVKDDDDLVIDLDGYDVFMQIREYVDDTSVLDELSTDNTRIVLTGDEGKIVLKFPSAVTSLYRFTSGVYDLEISTGGVVTRLLEGTVVVSKEVSR